MKKPRNTSVALVVFPMRMPMIRYEDAAWSIDEEDRSRGEAAGGGSGEGSGPSPADRGGRGASSGARGQPALRFSELLPEGESVDAARARPERGRDPPL